MSLRDLILQIKLPKIQKQFKTLQPKLIVINLARWVKNRRLHKMNNPDNSCLIFSKERLQTEYGITDELVASANLTWDALESIHNTHSTDFPVLQDLADYIARDLQKIPEVHSIRYRVKNPDHLIEKILRKNKERAELTIESGKEARPRINFENYQTEITDLIGIRALHLFKGDWEGIHNALMEDWAISGTPIANYRAGDSDEFLKMYKTLDCELKMHDAGYRSVHYLLEFRPKKQKVVAELQVRTIFEEAWSEVDHRVRYPYEQNNNFLKESLGILNRLAGSADEMATFVIGMKQELNTLRIRAIEAEKEGLAASELLQDTLSKFSDVNDEITLTKAEMQNLKTQLRDALDANENYKQLITNSGRGPVALAGMHGAATRAALSRMRQVRTDALQSSEAVSRLIDQ